jgi:hypothetical protein
VQHDGLALLLLQRIKREDVPRFSSLTHTMNGGQTQEKGNNKIWVVFGSRRDFHFRAQTHWAIPP